MKTILYKIPYLLLYSRLFVALCIVALSFYEVKPFIVAALSIYAILSDVFDGIMARALKISTASMRRLDTKIDTVFWFSCLFYIFRKHSAFLEAHCIEMVILVFTEASIVAFGFLKFNERISYHTILSKFWALVLIWFFIDLIYTNQADLSFSVSFWYGIIVQAEIILIALILKKNQTDVPGLFAAIKLRQGLAIKKYRMFNG